MDYPFSTHTFSFAFHLDLNGAPKRYQQRYLKEAIRSIGKEFASGTWEKSDYTATSNPLAYNEHQYYFRQVRGALYGYNKSMSDSKFNYLTFKFEDDSFRKIVLGTDKKVYELNLDDLHLSFYRLDNGAKLVGVLSLFTSNRKDNQKAPDDILAINEYFRHAYPNNYVYPQDIKEDGGLNIDYHTSKDSRGFYELSYDLPKKSWIGFYDLQDWLFMDVTTSAQGCALSSLAIPKKAIDGVLVRYEQRTPFEVHGNISKLFYYLIVSGFQHAFPRRYGKHCMPLVTSVADDRMHVHSWYGNKNMAIEIASESRKKEFDYDFNSDFWYKFLYIDKADPSQTYKPLRIETLKRQTDMRWAASGTLFGFNRYATVMLSGEYGYDKNEKNKSAPGYTIWNFNNIYFTMVQLTLIQRAAIQLLSRSIATFQAEVANLTSTTKRHRLALALARDFTRFRERFYHPTVTPQDQGIDFYRHLQDAFEIDRLMSDLSEEISFMTAQSELATNQERTEAAERLNLIVAVGLIPTLSTAFYGMNGYFGESTFGLDWFLLGNAAACILVGVYFWGLQRQTLTGFTRIGWFTGGIFVALLVIMAISLPITVSDLGWGSYWIDGLYIRFVEAFGIPNQ